MYIVKLTISYFLEEIVVVQASKLVVGIHAAPVEKAVGHDNVIACLHGFFCCCYTALHSLLPASRSEDVVTLLIVEKLIVLQMSPVRKHTLC